MATNRRFLSGSDVPRLTGNDKEDLRALREFLFRFAEQVGYEIRVLEEKTGAEAQGKSE